MRKTLFFAAVLAIAGCGAGAAHADSTQSRTSICWSRGNTFAISNCFARSAATSDGELNRLYAKILSVLDAGDRDRLVKSERLWVAYRDATCDAEWQLWGGGTGGPPARMACIDDETRHRLDYLATTYRLRLQKLDP